ncbi:MAG TPA: hypothetical protein VGR37_17440 [Longimicrobiaceae bacterium]|nr:hypothetical protein [Longimicrobiaceae bacterium]
MTGPKRGVSIARIREALARWVEKTSLRQAARETGMSPTGLRKVLGGSRLHTSTERKLLAWYLRHLARQGEHAAADVDTAAAALDLLTEGLPAPTRGMVAAGLLRRIAEGYRQAGLPVPAWVETLRSDASGRE